jgi:hypothetical protein
MNKPYSKTENISMIVIHLMYDNGEKEIKTFSQQQFKRFKHSLKWKTVLSATKLQEQFVTIKSKIYPEGITLKNKL